MCTHISNFLNFVFFFRFVGAYKSVGVRDFSPENISRWCAPQGRVLWCSPCHGHEPCGGGAVLNILRLPGCIRNIPKNTHVNNLSQVDFSSLPSPPQLHTDWALITMPFDGGGSTSPALTIQYAPDSGRESGAFLKKAGDLTYLRLRISSASFLICSGKGWERTRTARPLSSTSKQ